jgi:IPT/TIG domain
VSDPDAAQLIAGVALLLLTVLLAMVGRKDTVVQQYAEYDLPDGTTRRLTRGTVIPPDEVSRLGDTPVKQQRRTWLAAILVGKDHRSSTSKTAVFAWTLVVAFGLLSLLIALWLGDHEPWDAQVERGLQEEYLLLLGGPFAAAILAKYAAVSRDDTKTEAPVGSANASQLVNDDQGDTDLGDFQYVLFNSIAIAFFLGDFIGDLETGFPELPAILTGLVLTSTGGYAAKKLIAQAAPTLTSVVPPAASPKTEVHIFGTNLTVPSNVSSDGKEKAIVYIGPQKATVAAHDLVLGNDRITVKVPDAAKAGAAPISVARADGVAARGPSGMNVLPFEVLP